MEKRGVTPNWFAAVMGTGIVANAAVTLPHQVPGLRGAATVMWALAAVLLLVLVTRLRRGYWADPVMSQSYGAVAMAFLTVGSGTLLLGGALPGHVGVAWVLWFAGTGFGLFTACAVPYRMITRHQFPADAAFGAWLLPIVPPMVSAATGALLVPHAPAGQPRLTMLLACYAMFGLSLFAAVFVISAVYSRLMHHAQPAGATVPAMWIVLGPLGQSITAAGLLGNVAGSALPAGYAKGLEVFALVFGLATWGFAMLWLALALAVTRTARPSYSLGWWAFTFPLGTCVTGTSVLAARTGATVLGWIAVILYVGLVVAWATVAFHTIRNRGAAPVRLPGTPAELLVGQAVESGAGSPRSLARL
ncbi:TDT family transporter [Longispora albida]|uniref:TDT family transporter n=1 Tax=Longispora albida TaxID=203523 RepID=UPI0006861C99|nr:TDT family transporter [Longispora albida]